MITSKSHWHRWVLALCERHQFMNSVSFPWGKARELHAKQSGAKIDTFSINSSNYLSLSLRNGELTRRCWLALRPWHARCCQSCQFVAESGTCGIKWVLHICIFCIFTIGYVLHGCHPYRLLTRRAIMARRIWQLRTFATCHILTADNTYLPAALMLSKTARHVSPLTNR